jgi:hypothetical protein
MPRRWTHTEAFEHFGVVPRNIQWSWSARSEERRTVVVTVWQDQFFRRNGKLLCEHPPFAEQVRRRPGFGELMENLTWARDHCEGRLKVIIAKARDIGADPRSIETCFPSKMTLKLIDFDPSTGAYTAESDGL